jgi:undecaprenyl diphosphate synthase
MTNLSSITPAHKIPNHVAIIMDGNRRWAKQHGLPLLEGHRRGTKVARDIVELCAEVGVRYLTLYAFSSENWARPPAEVDALMGLLKHYLTFEVKSLIKNNVVLKVSGNIARLPEDLQQLIARTMASTAQNDGIVLNLALSYGSQEELVEACKRVASKVASQELPLESISANLLREHLYHPDIPDPDMFIRTSGEYRLSNFLLWQLAYTELFFIPTLWPDFSKSDFSQLLIEYSKRERRYGLRLSEKNEEETSQYLQGVVS